MTLQQDNRSFNKLLQSFDAWINIYVASFDYQLVLLDVWVRAFEEALLELQSCGTVENWQQFLQVWSRIFDRIFALTFRSEHVLQIQGKLLNASMKLWLDQQQVIEVFLKMNNLPTRTEVDEIHRSIYELKKEVKSLKKALAES
jgi:class III poly(R)-hydroxyalkanoic acid synthase PhaE subunit